MDHAHQAEGPVTHCAAAVPGQFGKVGLTTQQDPASRRAISGQQSTTGEPKGRLTLRKQVRRQDIAADPLDGQDVQLLITTVLGKGAEELEIGDILAEGILPQAQPPCGMIDG